MSLWIRLKSKTGRHLWLIDTHPLLWLVIISGCFFLNPILFAKAALFAMIAGAICFIAAKLSLFWRGIWCSWGPGSMTRWNARFYKTGYALMIGGSALLLLTQFGIP